MNLKDSDFIGVYDNVISEERCDLICRYFDKLYENKDEHRYQYGGGEPGKRELGRFDHQIFLDLDNNPVSDAIMNCLSNCWELYRKKYWVVDHICIDMKFEEIKLQKTPPRGGFHDWHCEVNDLGVVDRCIVWMLYLNDIPEGEGETEFLWQGLRIQPKAGRMVIWPAFYSHTHRGNTVYSKNKYIATGWGNYYYPDNNQDVSDYFEEHPDRPHFIGRKD